MTPAEASVLRAAVRWYRLGGQFSLSKHLKVAAFYSDEDRALARAVERLKAERSRHSHKQAYKPKVQP